VAIVLVSGLLGFWQEHGAASAVAKLMVTVQTKVEVLRGGASTEVPVEQVVPGDIVLLSAGSSVPGDCRVIESKDLFVDEATLTGETYPAEKSSQPVPPETPLAKRISALFMGTHVVSGGGKAVAVLTGVQTEFGKISDHLKLRPPETEFERGIRRRGRQAAFLQERPSVTLRSGLPAVRGRSPHPTAAAPSVPAPTAYCRVPGGRRWDALGTAGISLWLHSAQLGIKI
jgi:magnesium-transporting ATPase (P-type)